MPSSLNLKQNLDNYEDFYDMLTDSHHDLNDGQSRMLEAELLLLLANHIGDLNVLRKAFALARVNVERALPSPAEGV